MSNLYIEVKAELEQGTVVKVDSSLVPRVGEVIDISGASNSKAFGLVVVVEVYYKIVHSHLDAWVIAKRISGR
ncbi:hypothetical protein [Photobacterium lucens]|uniref:hypothetical protein n=1 Tax=Photobacterium lucens TaxID=2562949 RepID=UPI0006B5BF0E|nr:hypothetical protein [Photobacterium lucens]KPA51892.1 hypothetical protein VT25_17545 [Photobacterium leiognathi subsp. mandapamensis]MBP2701221.1 hypothetical protein [Vibrio parahaemolyticus]MZG55070.1 hypothetical protein [Photobacterium lucens]MZG79270.1 hypothetical protein [Photobacterium lucens]PSV20865.1 hypothetical protein C0W44_10055 [Photobacterium leiognathi subsp. mandapamensis]